MRKLLLIFSFLLSSLSYGGTFHAMIFSNMKESEQRAADRTAEMKNMREFCEKISVALGYEPEIRCHSDNEFTSVQFLDDISSMNVGPDDIVVLFYNGHGCNWDDDAWPHLCFKDRQYWETTAYEKLKDECGEAKLLLCIACCCNKDSSSRDSRAEFQNYNLDPQRTKELFLGDDIKSIITSSSIRGQASYSWTGGHRLGSIYGISLREALGEILNPGNSTEPIWENVFELAKEKTMRYTSDNKEGSQIPQYMIETEEEELSPRAQRVLAKLRMLPSTATTSTQAKVNSTSLKKDVLVGDINSMEIKVDFDIENMSDDGVKVVAFLESPKGVGVKDINDKFRTANGNVCVGKDFGTRITYLPVNDFTLNIPMNELHITDKTKNYFIRVGIFDYKSKKYIAFGDYETFKL